MGIFKDIKEAFLLSDVQIVNSNTVVKSPIDEAIKELTTNPKKKTINGHDYIKFGKSDDIPDILSSLIGKSATHAGIIGKKAKMVSGKNLGYSGTGSSGSGSKAIEWKVFSENAGGKNKSLESEFDSAAYSYVAYGGVGYLVQVNGGKLVKIKTIPARNIRLSLPNKDGEIETALIANTFKQINGDVFKGVVKEVKMYDKDIKSGEMLYYVSNPESDNQFYGIPNYIGAYNFIEADYEFGVTINNSASNGFSPKVLATFIGRNMSDEDKKNFSDKFKENFTGSDREQAVISWVRKKEEMPEFHKLDVANLDKTIEVMSMLNDAKILTAHSVTAPSLFGVVMPSKLGVSGSELRDAYAIMMSTEILPTRELLLKPLQIIIENSQFNKIKVEVEDEPLLVIENRGGQGADNGNSPTVKTTK